MKKILLLCCLFATISAKSENYLGFNMGGTYNKKYDSNIVFMHNGILLSTGGAANCGCMDVNCEIGSEFKISERISLIPTLGFSSSQISHSTKFKFNKPLYGIACGIRLAKHCEWAVLLMPKINNYGINLGILLRI